MPKRTRPRRGSLQYWPRKRTARIYSRTSHWPAYDEAKPLGFAGWKAGMTHVQIVDNNPKSKTYGKTITKPVTVIDSPSLFVCGFRFYSCSASSHVPSSASFVAAEKWADNLPKNIHKKIGKFSKKPKHETNNYDDIKLIVATQPEKGSVKKKKPEVFELGIGGEKGKKLEYANRILGKEIKAEDVFKPGEYADVSAVTKGYGFTGAVKRFGIRIQGRKDKQRHRHPGSIGSQGLRKVDWRVPQAGQYGFFNRTEFNKRIILIDNNLKKINQKGGFLGYGMIKGPFILVEGSVPGPRKRLIRLRRAVRTTKVIPVDIKYISTGSKQGTRNITA
jgi:large subunit ribosomal protein L3